MADLQQDDDDDSFKCSEFLRPPSLSSPSPKVSRSLCPSSSLPPRFPPPRGGGASRAVALPPRQAFRFG
ncbi:hypothetical protein NL676_002111 [Syzygium grande]|nr:hypothetical protein NL676_002111 [Syzygium grande]